MLVPFKLMCILVIGQFSIPIPGGGSEDYHSHAKMCHQCQPHLHLWVIANLHNIQEIHLPWHTHTLSYSWSSIVWSSESGSYLECKYHAQTSLNCMSLCFSSALWPCTLDWSSHASEVHLYDWNCKSETELYLNSIILCRVNIQILGESSSWRDTRQ